VPDPATLPLYFPTGSMLAVIRAHSYDPFGDGARAIDHWIGPCDMPYLSGREGMRSNRETRARAYIDIRAPSGSDVLKSDGIQLPNGLLVAVIAEPNTPRNPFTGWAPFVHFMVEEVS
jgi:hypothetical protein